ncbi:MAG: tRNA (adenosine(37)-N6)-threonylcarbamoyltransferase complex ATPase subunit type 1 TsaE [Gammaproteobacteria bacterium]|nr:tRNA (adenosine(37)-N6)-threonylcarbamoyltransferase complex ATPase subunit type 1 TsaE [Gammaproteobacteria bacterium]
MSADRPSWLFRGEDALVEAAREVAVRWRGAGLGPLVVALSGDLGSGKTTWVRAMLRGLGYAGRVPSPTYTLVELYPLDGLTLVHLDLYRLADDAELEHLGIRDWLDAPSTWLLVEWPERAQALQALADLEFEFDVIDATSRRVRLEPRSASGQAAVAALADLDSRYGS